MKKATGGQVEDKKRAFCTFYFTEFFIKKIVQIRKSYFYLGP